MTSPNSIPDPTTVSMTPTGMRYGVLLGLISIATTLLFYVLGWSEPGNESSTSTIVTIVGIALPIVMVVLAIMYHRDNELGGLISFTFIELFLWCAKQIHNF